MQLAGYTPNEVAAIQARPAIRGIGQTSTNGLDDYCPGNMYFNTETGKCESTWDGDNCPDGWHYDTLTYRCEPDEESECPEGTT